MQLNPAGNLVQVIWNALPRRFPTVDLDISVVIPNHVHGIITIAPTTPVGAGQAPPLRNHYQKAEGHTPTLGDIVRAFKSVSAIQVNRLLGHTGQPLWQRSYYEHVIHDEKELQQIRQYILENPLKWALDEENPGV